MTVHIPGKAVKQYKVAIIGTMGWMQSYAMFAILGPYYMYTVQFIYLNLKDIIYLHRNRHQVVSSSVVFDREHERHLS